MMMLQELAGALNLTFSLEAATSRGITSLSWDGVARKMAAYRRDLIINGLPLAWDLARALDVSLPVLQTSYGIGLKVWSLVCSRVGWGRVSGRVGGLGKGVWARGWTGEGVWARGWAGEGRLGAWVGWGRASGRVGGMGKGVWAPGWAVEGRLGAWKTPCVALHCQRQRGMPDNPKQNVLMLNTLLRCVYT